MRDRAAVQARRRRWLALGAILAVLFGFLYWFSRPPVRPHVLWIVLDACRAGNLSAYGNQRQTSPNLDGLAERGVIFEQNYAQSSWTVQSVPSYITGRYFPVPTLHWPEGQPVERIAPPEERTMPAILAENGYRTVMFSAHRGFITEPSKLSKEFGESLHVESTDDSRVLVNFEELDTAIFDWLDRLPPSGPEQPLFLYVHAVDPHFPHELEPPFLQFVDSQYSDAHLEHLESGQQVRRRDGEPLDRADRAYLQALHDGSVLYSDTHIGRLLERLAELGILDQTVVVVSADHGDALGEDGETVGHRGDPVDELLHVPLIMAGPGLPAGERVGTLTENVDIVPTLIDVLDLETTARPDGASLLQLVAEKERGPEEVFTWRAANNWEEPEFFVLRTPDYKYQLDRAAGTEHLWRVPDLLVERKDETSEHPEELERLRARVANRFVRLWQAYRALPFTQVNIHRSRLTGLLEPGQPIVGPSDILAEIKDDLWTIGPEGLCTAAWSEDAGELKMAYPVPDGAYLVEFGLPAHELQGRPASSLRVSVEGGPQMTLDTDPATSAAIVYLSAGEIEVTGGELDFIVASGDSEYWACLKALRLRPVDRVTGQSIEAESDEERRAREKELRALGYL